MAKPTKYPDWALVDIVDPTSGQNNVVEPGATQKNTGWTFKQFPPRQFFNWLHRLTNDWIKWFDERLIHIELGFVDRSADITSYNGWASFTTKKFFVREINDNVFISYIFEGPGDPLNPTVIYLPGTLELAADAGSVMTMNISIENGGSDALGLSVLTPELNSTRIYFYPNLTSPITIPASIWVGSGNKKVSGFLWFKKVV
jgi:hypothetical protein